jgi:hypothetical protein
LAVLSTSTRVHPQKVQKVRFCPIEILSQRDLLKNVALRLDLIKSNCLSHSEVYWPLNCRKVLAGNSYKVFTRKIQNNHNA